MSTKRLLAPLIPAWALCAAAVAADPVKVEKEDDHVSPVMAEVTFSDNTTRKVLVYGVGGDPEKGKGYHSHFLRAASKEGTDVRVWLDTLGALKAATEEEVAAVLKDGTERRLKHGNQVLHFANPDDSREFAFLAKLKGVKFLKPARKDGSGKAMFDHWLYSPYTGEKLPRED
jgi:hypothetical protein